MAAPGLLDGEELPISSLPCSQLSQCQALSLLPLASALWGTPTWGHPREPHGGQRRAPRLEKWSTSAVRKEWENWDCSAWTGPGASQVRALERSWQLQAAWQEATMLWLPVRKNG